MPKAKKSTKTKKYTTNVKDVKNTSCAKKECSLPMTRKFIDVQGSLEKDKEVKEKDVFDFGSQSSAKSKKSSKK